MAEKILPRNDEIVNYLFRPAKNIERKMLCEALGLLSIVYDIKEYQYIGFGSVYFADFSLFHKNLGIRKMISVEYEEGMVNRINFNRPYSSIDFEPGWSYDVLPRIKFKNVKSIIWLDYLGMLEGYMLQDITTFFQRAESGSVFIITVNVDLREDDGNKPTPQKIISKLQKKPEILKKVRKSKITDELKKEDYYSIIREVINEEINSVLLKRYKLEDTEYFYNQLFNFIYHDGQAMLTLGGILTDKADLDKFQKVNFDDLDFVRRDQGFYELKIPNLTNQEIFALNKYLPNFSSDENTQIKAFEELNGVVSEEHIRRYAKIYRYYPNFVESVI